MHLNPVASCSPKIHRHDLDHLKLEEILIDILHKAGPSSANLPKVSLEIIHHIIKIENLGLCKCGKINPILECGTHCSACTSGICGICEGDMCEECGASCNDCCEVHCRSCTSPHKDICSKCGDLREQCSGCFEANGRSYCDSCERGGCCFISCSRCYSNFCNGCGGKTCVHCWEIDVCGPCYDPAVGACCGECGKWACENCAEQMAICSKCEKSRCIHCQKHACKCN
ncbi:hypothetical protein BC829DRAFT_387709 [Chytridium lagenaria]|nr:hypothetical protein BC829DRAFT_387709 [Chytridium lagenaria]